MTSSELAPFLTAFTAFCRFQGHDTLESFYRHLYAFEVLYSLTMAFVKISV